MKCFHNPTRGLKIHVQRKYQSLKILGKDQNVTDRHTDGWTDNEKTFQITGQPRYLKVQGNGGNTSRYPKFDIAKM